MQVSTPRVVSPEGKSQFLGLKQDQASIKNLKEEVKNIDKGFSFGEPDSS